MDVLTVKKISVQELDQLQEIGRATFTETYAKGNSEENLNRYLENDFSAEKLTAELENPASKFYFAIQNDQVIGYLKVNFGPAQTELKDEMALEIERIYVLQDYHGKKIGQLLLKKALETAKNNKCSYIWLGVWEENRPALQFYTKNGFLAFDTHLFVLGDEEQTDIMMKLELN